MGQLGTLEELPQRYRDALGTAELLPLWPSLRGFLPYHEPDRRTRPQVWRYSDIRPLLLEAGELTPMEKAERRVLVLANPGYGPEEAKATPAIYIGMQLILPGESAPNHRHTPSAIRFVVEGDGGSTTVEGEKCPMQKGDLILTPAGLWHEHAHDGTGPVIWLDALDLPLIYWLESSYAVEAPLQGAGNALDASQTRYRRAGLVPYASIGARRTRYPLLRYPWQEVREALTAFASQAARDERVQLAYVNPETGEECLPTLGFSALMLRPGETVSMPRRSPAAVMHVIEGEGSADVAGATLEWGENDTFAIPTYTGITLANGSTNKPAFLFVVDEAPIHRKLGFYEEFSNE